VDRRTFFRSSAAAAVGAGGLSFEGDALDLEGVHSKPSDLRITDVRGCVLATHFPNPIIRIYTNQGIHGLGEVRDYGWIASALMMKPYLVGRSPFDYAAILSSIRHLGGEGRYGGGYSAIDIALMDLVGKAVGLPCWKLLRPDGRKFRDEVPLYAATGWVLDDARYRQAMRERVSAGYRHYKFNATPLGQIPDALGPDRLPTRAGLEVWGADVLRLREMIGYDATLGGQQWGFQTPRSGIELGEFMADPRYDLAFIEDVIDYRRVNAVNLNRELTLGSPTPTLTGEDLYTLQGFAPFIEANATDMVHPDMLTAGGMIETATIGDHAERFGVGTMMHAAASPVGQIAMVHCAAAIREFGSLEYQFRWAYMPWWDDLVSGIPKPIIRPGGVIPVPDGPGLGIEFEDEVAERYLMEPHYLPYDPGLFAPTPEFDRPMLLAEAREKGLIGTPPVEHAGPWRWWHLNEEMEYGYFLRGR
jgi:L-alanine-DL-glutamate epimerase-like enolase superfamily enzyme